ncbi:MAG: hypothetical protein EAZ13_04155 [Sphingobacteriia bacterium]|nr:MAG: hypothetical protein EAZ13_04155 [Sphingobacteriia bacterium]
MINSKQTIYKYLLAILFLSLSSTSIAQNGRRYVKETILFLNTIRFNRRLFASDTIKVLNYLSNKGLYNYLVIPDSEDWSRGNLNTDEKSRFLKLKLDTTKLALPENSISKVKLVPFNKEQNYIQFAKPIFYKKYTLCIFCNGYFSDGGAQETFLYKKIKGNWVIIRKLGGILNF